MDSTTGMIVVFAMLGIFLFIKSQNERKHHLQYLTKEKFYDQYKTQEENFVAYMVAYAKLKKAPTTSKEGVEEFFYKHMDDIKFGYVYVTGETLVISFLPTVIMEAAQQYLGTTKTP